MDTGEARIILVDAVDASRDAMAGRLRDQGYVVEPAADAAAGAEIALAAPPAAVIADLWMPSISGVQLCRLLKAEPATAGVPVILRGDNDDPRSRFWAERAGAAGYVRKGHMGELVRALAKAVQEAPSTGDFFMHLSGGSVDVRDRIARYLDAALFDSVIASEVRALAASGSFDRLFDLFAQFLCQVLTYRWVALTATSPARLALHHRPGEEQQAEQEARHALGLAGEAAIVRIVDEDALAGPSEAPAIVCAVSFGNVELGKLALAPSAQGEEDTVRLVELVARELGSPLRMAILMEQQQRLASVDPLTRLSNRRCFLERIGVEVARSHRYDTGLSVLLMDVDHFKAINDRHGHAAGDSVLSALGATLDQHVRACDVAARWGGEEFVVALPSTNLEGARGAAERMRALIEQVSVEHDGATIRFTVSVGAAELRPEETLAGLIDRADRAMYRAKTGGRNRVALEERRATPEPTPASGTSAEGLAS